MIKIFFRKKFYQKSNVPRKSWFRCFSKKLFSSVQANVLTLFFANLNQRNTNWILKILFLNKP